MKKKNDPFVVATHEAGHAVVALALGLEITEMSIVLKDPVAVSYAPASSMDLMRIKSAGNRAVYIAEGCCPQTPRTAYTIEANLQWEGMQPERLIHKLQKNGDLYPCSRIVHEMVSADVEAHLLLTLHWNKVEQLRDALLRKKRMNGDEVLALLGETPGAAYREACCA